MYLDVNNKIQLIYISELYELQELQSSDELTKVYVPVAGILITGVQGTKQQNKL